MPRRKKHYWLMKSEPDVYSIDDLRQDGRAGWDGVRNYQARNLMRDAMAVGDGVLFYHSSADVIGVAGLARVSRAAHPDLTQFDRRSSTYDPKATPEQPRWWQVEIEFVERFAAVVTLAAMKDDTKLEGMRVTQRGQRLSVQPVEPEHFRRVVALGRRARRG